MSVPRFALVAAACALAGCADRSPARNAMTAPAPAAPATATTAAIPAPQYVEQAGSSDLFEIQSSQLALERSTNPAVRRFAQQMIQDHSGSAAQLRSVTEQQNIPQPTLDPRHAEMLQRLQTLSGPQFDTAYMQMQVAGHRETLGLDDAYRTRGADPQLRALAGHAAPMVEQHLSEAEGIASNLAAVPGAPAPATSTVTPLR